MNDDQDTALPINAGDEASAATTPVEEPKAPEEAETPSEKTKPTGEVETEETQPETGESAKKGAQARIRELNAKAKASEKKAKGLEARIAELTTPVGVTAPQAPYDPQEPVIKPGEEIDGNELNRRLAEREQRILSQAEARADLKSRQSEAINRIRTETSQVVALYPELDPDSDSFDKELSDSVTEATDAYIKSNPYSASPKTFVEKMMRPYKRAVTRQVGQESENIARQVSQTAQRPTAISTSGKKPDSEKTIAELEAELGIHY